MSKHWGHRQEMLPAWHSSVQLVDPCFPCLRMENKDSRMTAFQLHSVIACAFASGCKQAGLPGCLPGPGAASSSAKGLRCLWGQMTGWGHPLTPGKAALLPALPFLGFLPDALCLQELNLQWPPLVFSVFPTCYLFPWISKRLKKNLLWVFFDMAPCSVSAHW